MGVAAVDRVIAKYKMAQHFDVRHLARLQERRIVAKAPLDGIHMIGSSVEEGRLDVSRGGGGGTNTGRAPGSLPCASEQSSIVAGSGFGADPRGGLPLSFRYRPQEGIGTAGDETMI